MYSQARPRESRQQQQSQQHHPQQLPENESENIKTRQEETLLWASGGMDSGISTGVNTTAHSVISGRSNTNEVHEHDNNEPTVLSSGSTSNPYEWGGGVNTAPSYDPSVGHHLTGDDLVEDMNQQLIQSKTHRVRQAMFPESLDEGMEIPSTQVDNRKPTAVQQLAEPSQMLKTAVANLIHYQDDTELATRAIPELIKLLNDDDQVVVSQAAQMVHQLSKKEASRYALVQSPPMLQALVQALNKASDSETIKAAAGVLHNLSQQANGRLAIFKSGGINALVRLLDSEVEAIVFFAITSIHNLLLYQEGSKMAVRLAGGIPKMCKLLNKKNHKFLAILTDCLQILAVKNQEAKLIILASDGPRQLVRIMQIGNEFPGARSHTYEKMLYTTCRVLKVLSVCPNNKPAIIQSGGVLAMAQHLDSPNERLVLNCLWTLRNLSDAATKLDGLDTLLHSLTVLLASGDLQFVTCSAGILSNLTCNNIYNKRFLTQNGGVDALIKAIRENRDREEVTEPSVCALRHLTGKHPGTEEMARNNVRLNYGLNVVVDLLQSQSRWPLIKAIVGLIRNLAICQANCQPLVELHAIPLLISRFNQAYNFTQQQRGSLASNGSIMTDGVRMEEIIEGTVSALYWLAKGDSRARTAIRMESIIPTLVYLIDSGDETITKAVVSLLGELAEDREGKKLKKVQSLL